MWKHIVELDGTDDSVAYAHCMLGNEGFKKTHTHTHTHTHTQTDRQTEYAVLIACLEGAVIAQSV